MICPTANLGTTACKWDSIIPFEPLWEQYERIIKDNGAIVLTASQPFTSVLITSNLKLFKYEWIWEKTIASNFLNLKKNPAKKHENVCVFYKKMPVYNPQMEEGKPYRDTDRQRTDGTDQDNKYLQFLKGETNKKVIDNKGTRFPSSIQKFPNPNNHNVHPTQKPVALFEYLIKTYTNEGEIVLDNCAGSFTTAVACDNTNRNWICIEKEEKYCSIGLTRINDNRERLSLPLLNSIIAKERIYATARDTESN